MATFQYSAMDQAGQVTGGSIDAPSRQAAIASLLERRLFVTTMTEAASSSLLVAHMGRNGGTGSASVAAGARVLRRRVSLRAVTMLFRQLATALEAGLPLLISLRVVREQSEHAAMGELVDDLAKRVEAGDAFSDAMENHPRVFTPLHVSMVRAGETAGVLDQVMGSLADFAERDLDTRERIRSASVYPAIVLVLALVSVAIILAFILPRIMQTLGDNPALLPLPTRMLMGISDVLRGYWWLGLIAISGGAWAFRRWTASPRGRLTFDAFKLRLPLLGKTLRLVAVGRFARALGTLSKSGIQIVEALHVLRNTLGNEAMGRAIDQVRAGVTQGQPIAEPLRDSGQFPPMFIQVVSLGEKTGRLDQLLLRAADSFDKDTAASIQRTMAVLPAVFICLLALLVGFILAAVLLPIVNMQSAVPGM